jgi:hypothetical protein
MHTLLAIAATVAVGIIVICAGVAVYVVALKYGSGR